MRIIHKKMSEKMYAVMWGPEWEDIKYYANFEVACERFKDLKKNAMCMVEYERQGDSYIERVTYVLDPATGEIMKQCD